VAKFISFSIGILSHQTEHCFGLDSVWGETRDSHEWRFVKGLMSRKLPHRQEGMYELEDTALAAKREQELPLEVISSIGA
jgi:hypothetical protein